MRLLLLVSSLALAACGNRTLPAADGGQDTGSTADRGITDTGSTRDGCVRPPGGCFGPQDCPDGQDCKGCYADPCCPMCAVCYGKCVSSDECWDNGDCNSDELCKFADADCGKTKPGTCTQLPTYCPELYSPTCGCDGKTYDSPCQANAAGVSAAGPGPCDQSQCTAVNASYQSALTAAKQCCPMCNSLQCTHKVKSDLACPCWTYVNDKTKLEALELQWIGLGCNAVAWDCPALGCSPPSPSGAVCTPGSATSGQCQDVSDP